MSDTILLDPDLFMALGLSAQANDGVGSGKWFDGNCPHCVQGHAYWLDGYDDGTTLGHTATRSDLYAAGLGFMRNDTAMKEAGVVMGVRVPFAKWCEIVGVDVRDG